jgi:hypothetical protein
MYSIKMTTIKTIPKMQLVGYMLISVVEIVVAPVDEIPSMVMHVMLVYVYSH